jgi:putative tryptophan/tyrosine transport system substrate-binding protein
MRRRDFIAGLGSAAASAPTWPRAARGQQVARRVGVLMPVLEDDPSGGPELAAFRQGLAELGWVEGRNIRIDVRWAGSDAGRADALAKELVALKPDVLLARSTPTTVALKNEAGAIPIVFVNIAADLVESGFVQSLARPGGNITGFANFEGAIGGKWLQLLKEADPRIARFAVIYNPQSAPYAGLFLRSAQSAAATMAVRIVDMPVRSEAEIEAELARFAGEPQGGLIAIPDSFTIERRDLIIALTARYRLPALYSTTAATPRGGLMAYAVDTRDLMRRAAGYVDRILKGAKAGELPVQQPVKFEFSINLKTAKALGLNLAATLIARADEVIE